MDIEFDREHCATMPVFDQDILDGIPYKQMQDPKAWIDSRIRIASKSFPDEVEFLGSRVCTPQEAFIVMTELTSKIDKNKVIDMATSNVFMVRYDFRALGVNLIPRYMFLPNFKKGNRIKIAGKDFHAMPILTDPGFSVTGDYVFLRMTRAPVTFKRVIHTVMRDGETLSSYITHSKLHWKGGANDRSRESDMIRIGNVVTTLSHYLFCKYGVEEAFRRYANTHILILNQNEITDEMRKKYTVYQSRQIAPRALKLKIDYSLISSTLAILIPKKDVSLLTEDMIVSMWYIIDHFPEIEDPMELFTDWQWKVWLGYVLWGDQLGHGKLVENVETHLNSLDDYVDIQTQQTLKYEENLEIDDIYHLFSYVISNMNDLINNNEDRVASMYGKRLVSVPYILKDITEKIFKCMFELTNNRKRQYTVSDYNQIFGKYFTVSTIMGLRNTSKKPFMAHISSPGDNMYYRGTSRLVMQAKTGESMPGASNKVNVDDPANHLHVSGMECGSYGVLPHAFPLAKATINPTALLDETYTLTPKPHLQELRQHVAKAIER